MTEEQLRYLDEWINRLNVRSEILEVEMNEISKRKDVNAASKNIMIDVRKELLDENKKRLELLNILKEKANDITRS